MDKSSFLAEISKIIAGLKEVDLAYIFGSFLEDEEFNDIDVALLLSEEMSLDPYKSLKFSLKIAGELEGQIKPRFEFDVKILNSAPVEFQFEVIKKGKVIFSIDESRRIDFEFEVISTYLDLKYMYDILDKEFLART
jgi:predicted nucleotidyltransferase